MSKSEIWTRGIISVVLVVVADLFNQVVSRMVLPYTTVAVGFDNSASQIFAPEIMAAVPGLVSLSFCAMAIWVLWPVMKSVIKNASDEKESSENE